MDRSLKFFFLFCFAVFFFSGCSKAKNSGSASGSIEIAQNAEKPAKPENTSNTIDTSKMTFEQKMMIEAMARDVSNLIPLFKDADSLFQQAWEKIWNDKRSRPDNVFRLVWKSLTRKYSEKNGLPLLSAQKPCDLHDYTFSTVAPGQYRLVHTDCTNPKIPRIEEMATLSKTIANGRESWRIDFASNNLRRFLGNSLSLLGVRSQCSAMMATGSGRLQFLRCTELGQNYNSEMYLEILNLNFDRSAQKPLMMKAIVFDGLQKPKYKFEASDVPVDNSFVIKGEETPREDLEQAAQAAAQPVVAAPPPTPPTPPVTPAPAGIDYPPPHFTPEPAPNANPTPAGVIPRAQPGTAPQVAPENQDPNAPPPAENPVPVQAVT